MIVCTLAVLFTIVLLNVFVVCDVVLSPVVLILSVANQVNVDPPTLLVRGILTATPPQIVTLVVLVITGVVFTTTVTVLTELTHPPTVAVTE